jgi:hypothetical protein
MENVLFCYKCLYDTPEGPPLLGKLAFEGEMVRCFLCGARYDRCFAITVAKAKHVIAGSIKELENLRATLDNYE